MTHEKKLLIGRLLTRSGDHAWDFAVPLALLHAFPGKLQVAAVYYLLSKLFMMLMTPRCGRWIDATPRLTVLRSGIGLQFVTVILGGLAFWQLDQQTHLLGPTFSLPVILSFSVLLATGVFASLGALITDISIGNDVVPSLVPSEGLTVFNSWLRRVDLASEVVSPVLAGLLFALRPDDFHLLGFYLIVFWNVISFFPEYFLLQSAISKIQETALAMASKAPEVMTSFWSRLLQFDPKAFRREPLALLLLSYALLWLSALSPHGVLLTGYLQDHTRLPEAEIGLFRGLGAVFGLVSTLSFPWVVKRWGLLQSSRLHIGFQAMVLIFGAVTFAMPMVFSIYWFLTCVLLSRIGLYGFMNGEFELRQRLIPSDRRGRVNSLSSVLTTLATLALFSIGALLPDTEDFRYLVFVSVTMVVAGFVIFHFWSQTSKEAAQLK